ncbi:DUF7282 domain-containing protein [Halomicrobium katesii]|uniref:DUF7282 domain-containing protein n=1 Tax=Halomicrobium katesii TaxID=437163 RepID=UPI0009B5CC35|nr:BGTF surface domain-containing protein [Halomicrobium katesii]
MTGTNDKVRSLFLSALMVMSVVAMGTAFTAGAVADTSGNATTENVDLSNTDLDITGADEQTQTISFDAYLEDGDDTETVTIDTSGAEDADLTLNDAEVVTGTGIATVSEEDDDEVVVDLDSSGSVSGTTVEVELDWDVTDASSRARVTHELEATGDQDGPYTADLPYRVLGESSVTIDTTNGVVGGDSFFRGENVRFETGGTNVEIIIYDRDTDETDNRAGGVETLNSGDLSSDIVWDSGSSELNTGESYVVAIGGSNVQDPLRVRSLGLGAEADSESITTEDEIAASVNSSAPGDTIDYRLLDDDGDVVTDDDDTDIEDSTTLDGTGDADIELPAATDSDYGTGNYSIEVEHGPTGITTETDSIEITEAGDGDVSFAGNGVFTDEAGDIANVTVEMTNTDEATVTIGTEEQGYYIVYQVTDESGDGQVSLEFNSYTAGRASQENVVDVANGDDEIDFITQDGDFTDTGEDVGTDTLDPTEYEMNATVGHVEMGTDAYADSDALGTLSLQPRSTDGMQSWVTPKGTDLDDLSDDVGNIYDEIGSSITESGEVAYDDEDDDGDTILLQLEAGGLEGAVDNAGGLETFIGNNEGNADDEAIDLTIEQTNEDANRSPKELDLVNDDAISVIEDPENNSYFVAVETSNLEQPARDLAEGDNFEATFTIEQDNVLNSLDDDESEEVSSEFTLVEPSTELVTNTEDDLILIESASSQTVSGQTNYAPGTDLTVRVQSSDNASPFQTRPEATVQTDGTFTTDGADFSDVSPGTNLTLQTRRGGSPVGDEYDGRIGEVPTASVSISNQTTDGSTVTVDSVTTENGGFVAIHLNNASGEVIGNSEYLDSGTQQDVEISLDSALDENATVVAMPHQDTNDNEEYNFGDGDGADGPYTENGSAVTDSATVTIQTTEDTDTPTDTPEDTPTDTATPDEGEDTPEDTSTDDGGDETTTGDGAGFGAVVALVGLLAAALLATRRNN